MSQRPDTDDYAAILLADSPLIDTRAPIEYAKGGLPNSVNLPLMSDDEREQVGTCYKQQGQQQAIELGHRLVSGELKQQRVKAWTEFAQRHPDGYIYCFRGGLRSNTSRRWMRDAGVDYPLIKGGYKAVRRYLIDLIDEQAAKHPWLILSGRTGTGKTRVLDRVDSCIDLEGLANHRGSSFGRRVQPQPSQIDFENALGVAMLKKLQYDQGPWLLEDESRLIGRISLPLNLHEAMAQAPIVVLEESMATRVEQVRADYVEDLCAEHVAHYGERAGFEAYSDYMVQSLYRVRKRLGMERHEQMRVLMLRALKQHRLHQDISLHDHWIEAMLGQYYDPMYDYQLSKKRERVLFRGNQQQIIDWFADYRQRYT